MSLAEEQGEYHRSLPFLPIILHMIPVPRGLIVDVLDERGAVLAPDF